MITAPCISHAFGTPAKSLNGIKIPPTPGLLNGQHPIVINKTAAIQLGKALFWDINVGSDGIACASCHYHAGADVRTRNQLNPGILHNTAPTSTAFETTASGAIGGPDYSLKASDFPLYKLSNPANRNSVVIFNTDDVVGSSGVFLRQFDDITLSGDANDLCTAITDDIFHLDGLNTRQATPRNAPSVINAIFNYRNFWDGRANNVFNGESAYGPRDPQAGVWLIKHGKPVKKPLLLENASLASLAVAPPLNDVEMTCVQRQFQHIAKKLLTRRPLDSQAIHPDDSVLGVIRHASSTGLTPNYQDLIKQAFAKRYWNGKGDFGITSSTEYPQMEANFAMFFGLAIQLYEATLISDQSPFDGKRDAKTNYPLNFTAQQKHGLELFAVSECAACHLGPTFSSAAHPDVYRNIKRAHQPLVNRSAMFEDLDGFGVMPSLIDIGFIITSVSSPDQDVGLGGTDPYGHPFSFAQQYANNLANPQQPMVDPIKVVACELGVQFNDAYAGKPADFLSHELIRDPNAKHCRGDKAFSKVPSAAVATAELGKPLQGRLMTSVKGAFKIPSLRNVELTGPYMHNGSMKSLEEVVEFYNRGGNNFHNPQHTGTLVFPQGFSESDKADLVAFLKTLTDERVRWERAPFDHPALPIPHGHVTGSSPLDPALRADDTLYIPAIGKTGRSELQGPLQPFEYYLSP